MVGLVKIEMVNELSRGAMVETATLLEEECGMSIDFLGRYPFDRAATLTLEATGRYLSYKLKADGGWLFLRCCPLDLGQSVEVLVTGRYAPRSPDDARSDCRHRNQQASRLEPRATRYASRAVYAGPTGPAIFETRSLIAWTSRQDTARTDSEGPTDMKTLPSNRRSRERPSCRRSILSTDDQDETRFAIATLLRRVISTRSTVFSSDLRRTYG
jgi:hypothetical protein